LYEISSSSSALRLYFLRSRADVLLKTFCTISNKDDHLDIATLTHLYKAQPKDSIHFFAPLGNKSWFMSNIGCKSHQVTEMDWWETRNLTLKQNGESSSSPDSDPSLVKEDGLKVTATPCQHFTGRGIFDRNDTLWASWSVEGTRGGKVWFAGEFFQLGPSSLATVLMKLYDIRRHR
jgi:hypothetical protein